MSRSCCVHLSHVVSSCLHQHLHQTYPASAFSHLALTSCLGCSTRELQLDTLSPVLAQLPSANIPMPGFTIDPAQHRSTSSTTGPTAHDSPGGVTVASFKPAVHVMSTKTRPKRLGMVGSDGKTYTFLLKVGHCLTTLQALDMLTKILCTVFCTGYSLHETGNVLHRLLLKYPFICELLVTNLLKPISSGSFCTRQPVPYRDGKT